MPAPYSEFRSLGQCASGLLIGSALTGIEVAVPELGSPPDTFFPHKPLLGFVAGAICGAIVLGAFALIPTLVAPIAVAKFESSSIFTFAFSGILIGAIAFLSFELLVLISKGTLSSRDAWELLTRDVREGIGAAASFAATAMFVWYRLWGRHQGAHHDVSE